MMKRTVSGILIMAMAMSMAFTLNVSQANAVSKPIIQEVEYDREDREISVEFYGRVKWKKRANIKVAVTDMKGKKYTARLRSYDSDDCDIYVKGIKIGKKYKVKISGVKKVGGKFTTVTKKFIAWDD